MILILSNPEITGRQKQTDGIVINYVYYLRVFRDQ